MAFQMYVLSGTRMEQLPLLPLMLKATFRNMIAVSLVQLEHSEGATLSGHVRTYQKASTQWYICSGLWSTVQFS